LNVEQVFVAQPTVETTISILRGLKQRYEVHHSVKITDSALVAALSFHRYISDRFQIKQLTWDEAAAQLKMEITKPAERQLIGD